MDAQRLWEYLQEGLYHEPLSKYRIAVVLLMVGALSLYQFVVYRFMSKRGFYNKQLSITIAAMPFFIATIVLTLQLNIAITLGTIGALAILRFRTAIKDPMDMLYLLWATHTGIVCGCGLYELGIIVSLVVTVFIVGLDFLPMVRAPYLLIVNAARPDIEPELLAVVKKHARLLKVKSRNVSATGMDMILELTTKTESALLTALSQVEGVEQTSLISNDSENI